MQTATGRTPVKRSDEAVTRHATGGAAPWARSGPQALALFVQAFASLGFRLLSPFDARRAGLRGEDAPCGVSSCSMAAEVVRYPVGAIPSDLRAGDLILIRSRGLLAFSIRAAGWLRHRKSGPRYAHWSHAAIAVSSTRLVEVHAAGVGLCSLEKYRQSEFHHVRLDLDELPRRRAANYAASCLRQPYGIASFVLLGLAIVFGDSFRVPDKGGHGCVALIVRALQRAGLTFDREPQDMTPADLARNLGVLP